MLKQFDANRPEIKQHKPAPIRRITLKHPPKKVKEKPVPKHRIEEVTEHRYRGITDRPTTFFGSSSPSKSNATVPIGGKIAKKKSIAKANYLKAHHLLAGRYVTESTNLKQQYAAIRKKNANTLSNCRKKRRRGNSKDWTDRFCTKIARWGFLITLSNQRILLACSFPNP